MINIIIVGALISLIIFLVTMYFNFKQLEDSMQKKGSSDQFYSDQKFNKEAENIVSYLIAYLDNKSAEQRVDNTKLRKITSTIPEYNNYTNIDDTNIIDFQSYNMNKEAANG
jgi:uncharacterized membrane protein required for colicin V production